MITYTRLTLLLCVSTIAIIKVQAQQDIPVRNARSIEYIEYETSYREELIDLDTLIISQVNSILSSEGCVNLEFFLSDFHHSNETSYFSSKFNFKKFHAGFGNALKKEIVKSIVEKGICIDEIIANTFAPGNCFDSSVIFCHPISELIFIDRDPKIVKAIKNRISTKGYKIKYNIKNIVEPIFRNNVNREWINLFTTEELDTIDHIQLDYLRSL